ncbi:acyl carrier protein [Phytohabitans sp. ZYX-F-186]|uniref:Acyl carrier protein n=1 Tax=Phytohabitans maris TaxID=3071409 RepID=A0ABU0ZHQ3_9ACTN|nr:acyl carrier protein [Phytohabitans sp. ZYX-F-186]MDQ7905949.1 acyl carrier protein [Phytohabitans sp. ZYX-F-186]
MASTDFDEAKFQSWLIERLATHLKREASDIDVNAPLADYGLDSLYALAIVADIEDYLNISVDATIMWDHPTVAGLASALATQVAADQVATE